MANFRLSRKICICLVIVLIFSNSVFAVSISSSVNAQASYTRIGQFNQYITNNYGSQTADADTTLLIGMYQSLAKLAAPGVAYGIDRINHTYYLTGTLTYLQEYLMQITENQYDIYKSEDTYLDGLSSVVSDIKTNTANSAAADQAALTFLGSLESLEMKDESNSTVIYDSRYSERYIRPGVNCSVSLSNGVFSLTNFTGNYPVQSIFTIPMFQGQYTFVRFDIYTPKELTISPLIYSNAAESFRIPSNSWITITSYKQPDSFGSGAGGFTITDSTLTSSDVVKIRNVQYITSPDLAMNKEILDSINDLEVNVDINDSVNVTPILLDVDIGINDFTAVNTVSNKLRTWLSTGVSVSALIGALDDLDDSFFTLSNRNTIETINNQYTDFYD